MLMLNFTVQIIIIWNTIKNQDNYRFVKGNITNRHLMEDLISECDAVVNFAAESFVDRSIA